MALMLIDGSIFLHVPKTGGSWVARVLQEQGLVRYRFEHGHASVRHVMAYLHPLRTLERNVRPHWSRFVPPKERDKALWAFGRARRWLREQGVAPPPGARVFLFCFVRHPVDWWASYWSYRMKYDWAPMDAVDPCDPASWHPWAPLRDIESRDFDSFVRQVIERAPGYVARMYDEYTGPCVRFVGRQERLVDDLIHVLRMRGLPFDEGRLRGAHRVNEARFEARWDPELRREIARLEYAALRRFGYEEEGLW